jgi:dihydrofolate synthase/folylpolyglutamate synthase
VFTRYTEALQYLYTNLPIFQRVGAVAYRADLTNTIRLCEVLGNPQHHFKSIHVAGTNGKGSTSHMLASILQEAGYKTGLYTSPHLKEFTERIRINGNEIDPLFVVDFVNRIKPSIEEIKPSFFEITVAMAFDFFARKKVEIAVIEVGLGGRLDSTNVIHPLLSVITNIGWDHMDILGDSLPMIAAEKAGIIKHNVPVLISERQHEVEQVFIDKAAEESAPVSFASDEYKIERNAVDGFNVYHHDKLVIENLSVPLQGNYQQKNLAAVLKSVDVLRQLGYTITQGHVLDGLRKVIVNTHLKGRWQKLNDRPLMICDTGHNVDGITQVVRQIRSQKFKQLHFVLGMVKDKDITKVLSLLPVEAKYYFCQAKIPRAMDADQLALKAAEFNLRGSIINDVNEAVAVARKEAADDDMIFIGGSTFVVAEIENL